MTYSTQQALAIAISRIEDMLMDDDGVAFKEARKSLPMLKEAFEADVRSTLNVESMSLMTLAKATYKEVLAIKKGLPETDLRLQEIQVLKDHVEGCFRAAEIEGLQEALAETTDERLKDLVERCLLHARNFQEV